MTNQSSAPALSSNPDGARRNETASRDRRPRRGPRGATSPASTASTAPQRVDNRWSFLNSVITSTPNMVRFAVLIVVVASSLAGLLAVVAYVEPQLFPHAWHVAGAAITGGGLCVGLTKVLRKMLRRSKDSKVAADQTRSSTFPRQALAVVR